MARRLRTACEACIFNTGQEEELLALRPSCHQEVESAWDQLRVYYWSADNCVKAHQKFQLCSKAHRLMRDLDAIRRKPEAKTLKAFALRVGVRQIWEL